MTKRVWETEKQFQDRVNLELAKKKLEGNKLWRISAIEMKKAGEGAAWQMGRADHFTVKAFCEEMAIGIFFMAHKAEWFVTGVELETVIER